MSSQWIILGIIALILGPAFAAPKHTKEQPLQDSECWNNPDFIQKLFSHPYTRFPLETFGCKNFVLLENTNPDISDIKTLDRQASFSIFDSRHRELFIKLVNILKDPPDEKKFVANALYIRDQVNPQLFHHALEHALDRRQIYEGLGDTSQNTTRRRSVVNNLKNFLWKFIDGELLESPQYNPDSTEVNEKVCVELEASQTDDKEKLLSYFRDDFGVNVHHDSWHTYYQSALGDPFPRESRIGELFYYMHKQYVARYNFERLNNGLNRAVALHIGKKRNLLEGYSTPLRNPDNQRFPIRFPNTELDDFMVNDTGVMQLFRLSEVEGWVQNIAKSIEENKILHTEYNGRETEIPLTAEEFIDVLAKIIATPDPNPTEERYGNVHTMGHKAIAVAHDKDKDKRITDPEGVMTHSGSAARDPSFYRWHTRLQELFIMHKNKLPPYNSTQLGFDGVKIESAKVETEYENVTENEFLTFWDKSKLYLSNRLNYDESDSILHCYTHLQHRPFTYIIEVESNREVVGIVRIFMAPKNNENGEEFNFAEQRHLFFELDTFPIPLKEGKNVIKRDSVDASVTTPTEKSFGRQPMEPRPMIKSDRETPDGCGWPDYLLIPKGTPEGTNATLFVMISDWENDKVGNISIRDIEKVAAISLCGSADVASYPFKRPMGFPFDRVPQENSLTEFSSFPNMHVIDTKIRFTDFKIPDFDQ